MASTEKSDMGSVSSTDIKKIDAYLSQGRILQERLAACEMEMDRLYSRATSPPSASRFVNTKVQQSSPEEAAFVQPLESMETLKQYIMAKQRHLEELRVQILSIISQCVEGREAQILLSYYIDGNQWNTIAKKMHYSTRNLYRLRDVALSKIVLPEDAIWLK